MIIRLDWNWLATLLPLFFHLYIGLTRNMAAVLLTTTTMFAFGPQTTHAFWTPTAPISTSSSVHTTTTVTKSYKDSFQHGQPPSPSSYSMMEKLRLSDPRRQSGSSAAAAYERSGLPQSVVAWLDPDSLSPSSLAAAIHQVVKVCRWYRDG